MEKTFSDKDPFCALFLKALNEISSRYACGALRYGERKFPLTILEIKRVEEGLNALWKSGDEEALVEFRNMLKRWYLLHLRIIEDYRSRRKR